MSEPPIERLPDERLYVLHPEEWSVRMKTDWVKEYCYQQAPGQDFFHALAKGELYLQRDHEKLCLNCAWRRGLLTRDRLYWQRRHSR